MSGEVVWLTAKQWGKSANDEGEEGLVTWSYN